VRTAFCAGGALFFDDLPVRLRLLRLEAALSELAAQGLAGCDGLAGLRATLRPRRDGPASDARGAGGANGHRPLAVVGSCLCAVCSSRLSARLEVRNPCRFRSGVGHSESICSMAISVRPTRVLVITPTADEYRPLHSALGAKNGAVDLPSEGDSSSSISVAAIGGQGQTAAYACVTRLLNKRHPSLVILSGIAGARFDADVGPFDCIAAVSCVDYSVSERLPKGVNRPTSTPLGPTTPRAEEFTSGLPQWEPHLVSAIESELARTAAIAPRRDRVRHKDITAQTPALRSAIAVALREHSQRSARRFIAANVCSSNDLHKDADYLHRLIGGDKRLAIVEMEFAGVYRACYQAGVPCLMVRAISDVVGYKKQPEWTSHATFVAAAAVKALFSHLDLWIWIREVEFKEPTVSSRVRHAELTSPAGPRLSAPALLDASHGVDGPAWHAFLRSPVNPLKLRDALRKRLLQVALDVTSIEEAERLAGIAVSAGADLLEVGDPLLRRFGFEALTRIRLSQPDTPLIAEFASSDWADEQVRLAADAGADIVSLIGLANEPRIARAVYAARAAKVGIFVEVPRNQADLSWCKMAQELGVDGVSIIRNIDATTNPKASWDRVKRIRRGCDIPIAVSGGFGASHIAAALNISWNIVIVGRAIVDAPDPASVLNQLVSLVRG